MSEIGWDFSYPYYDVDSGDKYWYEQDLTKSAYFMTGDPRKIYNLIVSKTDMMFVEKNADGNYELSVAFADTKDIRYLYNDRLLIWHELQCFTSDRIRIFMNNYEDEPFDDNDVPTKENSYFLSDILAQDGKHLYDEFIQKWTSHHFLNLHEQPEEDFKIKTFSEDEIAECMAIEESILVAKEEAADRLENGLNTILKSLEEKVEKFKGFSAKLEMLHYSTLILIKPQAVANGLVGPVMDDIVRRGFSLLTGGYVLPTLEDAELHYQEHKGKPWFEKITKSLSSGRIFFAIVGSKNKDTVKAMRKFIGDTDPKKAEASTIRARYGTGVDNNIIHGSDSFEAADREKRLWMNVYKRFKETGK